MYYIQCTCAGTLLGFTNLGEIDTHLTHFEQSLEGDKAEGSNWPRQCWCGWSGGCSAPLSFPAHDFHVQL